MRRALLSCLLWGSLCACSPEVPLAVTPQEEPPLLWVDPPGFPEAQFEPSNPYHPARVELGRRLFFEPRLSGPGTISCATCHEPEQGFADGLVRSVGASGKPLARHTPALFNLAWVSSGFFWDGGAKNLESLVFGPLTDPDEMAGNLVEIAAWLQEDESYPTEFELAFEEPFQIGQVAMALAQYLRSLVSVNSKYDQARQGKAALSEAEVRGLALVEEHCSSCHAGELFTNHEYKNNGIAQIFSEEEEGISLGRARVTGDPADRGKWRTPTLRNVTKTAPYMHDGRFASLEEVLEHYRSGIQEGETLAPELQGGIPLSSEDVQDILSFLQTLSAE